MSGFVHLHNHTHYSLLDGLQKIKPMLDYAKELNMPALAITDHGTLAGAIEFYKYAKEVGVKPIIGMEAYVAARGHLDKEGSKDRQNYHLILIAKNTTGYTNLVKLSTISHLEGFYFKPRIDHELLKQYSEGLIVLSGCAGGEIADQLYKQKDYAKAKETALWYKELFGEDYYLELQEHQDWQMGHDINNAKIQLAEETGIKYVITKDCHYTYKDQHKAHDILLCVQTGNDINDPNRFRITQEVYFTTEQELRDNLSKDYSEEVINIGIANTLEVEAKVDLDFDLDRILIPEFPNGDITEEDQIESDMFKGVLYRYRDIDRLNEKELLSKDEIAKIRSETDPELVERIDFEFEVIKKMGYSGYLLIVADLNNYSRNNGIAIGPGRGSAAGSILCYLLRITEIDPMEYNLLFERFLNPDRISMPDIDMDFADDRRDEVIEYSREKYGGERVAHIGTFGTMAARNAVRDTGRVLGYSYSDVDGIAKKIPAPVQGRHIPLKVSIVEDNDLKSEYENNPTAKEIIDQAIQLEGTIRNTGVHAAGVVIAKDRLDDLVPLMRAQKGGVVTQYSMNYVEGLGLLKFDFLGLSNLTIIANAQKIIAKVYGDEFDISKIDLTDQAPYKVFTSGNTTGIFQFESEGIRKYLKKLKPNKFEDIIAMVALYRPGPLGGGFTDEFIKRKNRPELIDYPHPSLEGILEPTLGVVVYQEQVMEISKVLSGFTGGEADTLRKAMGKKQRDTLAKLKQKFIDGGLENSDMPKSDIESLWAQLEDFADYGFNKSHAACYAFISMQTAFLKAHYPAAFMAALMTSNYDNTERIALEISECKRMGLDVVPPNINESFNQFGVIKETGQISYGLKAIKNVGEASIDEIIEIRKEGKFTGLNDFITRIPAGVLNKKILESLIKVGALDIFEDRSKLLDNLDIIIEFNSSYHKNSNSNQAGLFSDEEDSGLTLVLGPVTGNYTDKEILSFEKELMGLYLTDHPMREYMDKIEEFGLKVSNLNKEIGSVAGMVLTNKEIITKKGDKMSFTKFEAVDADIELIVFPRVYAKYKSTLEADIPLLVSGKIDASEDEKKILVDKIIPLVEMEESKTEVQKGLPGYRLEISNATQDKIKNIKSILDDNPGGSKISIFIENDGVLHELPMKVSAKFNSSVIHEIISLENIKIIKDNE